MIRVMVVEDEPAAMSYITSLLQSKCSDMSITCCAEDGQEAMDMLMSTKVDVVITDIQMAGINGIELARWIRQRKPDILTLIISGYSDFDYAKGAIQSGVVEYLLKPIRPAEFAFAMEKIVATAKQIKRDRREKWLSRAFTGTAQNEDVLDLWPKGRMLIGAIRNGMLPSMPFLPSVQFDYPAGVPENLAAVHIRDESEIGFALSLDEEDIAIECLTAKLSGTAPYFTALTKIIMPNESCASVSSLPKAAQKIAVPGISQTVEYTEDILKEQKPPAMEDVILKRLNCAISNYQPAQIKDCVCMLFVLWEKENRRLISVERILNQVFQLIAKHVPQGHDSEAPQLNMIDDVKDICHCAQDFPDMLKLTLDYCQRMFWSLEHRGKRGDLLKQIEVYIQVHLGEPLSTQQICAVFCISQSYLSQLFRKHENTSFIEYVTIHRIEEAKRMMFEFPDMPIKDIAARLGFSDPFYFSKVFRSLAGIPPSEYRGSVGFSM